jgi:hypothetical protein
MFQLFTSHHQAEELKDYYNRVLHIMICVFLVLNSHLNLKCTRLRH